MMRAWLLARASCAAMPGQDRASMRKGCDMMSTTMPRETIEGQKKAAAPPPKIAMIGAGGVVFPLRLMGDFLGFPELRGATYALMDLDLGRAERTATAARNLATHYGFPATIEATTDR